MASSSCVLGMNEAGLRSQHDFCVRPKQAIVRIHVDLAESCSTDVRRDRDFAGQPQGGGRLSDPDLGEVNVSGQLTQIYAGWGRQEIGAQSDDAKIRRVYPCHALHEEWNGPVLKEELNREFHGSRLLREGYDHA